MTYQEKFASAIRVNGKVLRENNNVVSLPFGSEYEIRLKNINTVRAQVKVSIDGKEATDGWLILNPNSTLDLAGWVKNNNKNGSNKFKFIERTANIEKHRGIEVEDGLVRIEYRFEKIYKKPDVTKVIHEHHYNHPWIYPYYGPYYWPPYNQPIWTLTCSNNADSNTQYGNYQVGEASCDSQSGSFDSSVFNVSSSTFATSASLGEPTSTRCASAKNASTPPFNVAQNMVNNIVNDAGITVPGSENFQKFHTVSDFECEESHVMVLKLVGVVGNKEVTKPITVDYKPTCTICGHTNKANNKFCSECGTALIIR